MHLLHFDCIKLRTFTEVSPCRLEHHYGHAFVTDNEPEEGFAFAEPQLYVTRTTRAVQKQPPRTKTRSFWKSGKANGKKWRNGKIEAKAPRANEIFMQKSEPSNVRRVGENSRYNIWRFDWCHFRVCVGVYWICFLCVMFAVSFRPPFVFEYFTYALPIVLTRFSCVWSTCAFDTFSDSYAYRFYIFL